MVNISYDETKVDGEKFLSVLSADKNLIASSAEHCQHKYGKGLTIRGYERKDGQVCLFYIEPRSEYISGKFVECYTAFISDGVESIPFGMHFTSQDVLLAYASDLQGKTKEDCGSLSSALAEIEVKAKSPIDRHYSAEQIKNLSTSKDNTL